MSFLYSASTAEPINDKVVLPEPLREAQETMRAINCQGD